MLDVESFEIALFEVAVKDQPELAARAADIVNRAVHDYALAVYQRNVVAHIGEVVEIVG